MNVFFRSPRMRWGFLLLLVSLMMIAGCNGDDDPPSATATPEPDDEQTVTPEVEPDPGGSLIVSVPEEPESLNFTLTNSPSAHWILSTVDARMIRINAENEYEPQLLREVPTIENGGISEDGLTYTIRFLPDLTWSNGEPLDARDFRFTWETITSPDYPATTMRGWSDIEDVTVSSDNLSAVIRLESPSAGFVDHVLAGDSSRGSGFLLPRHQLEDLEPEEIGTHEYGADAHVGAGPFEVVEWEPGAQLTVERSDTYWGDPPLLDRIAFRFTDTPRDAIGQVTTGDIDMAVSLSETILLDAIETDEAEAYITPRAGAVQTYAFNLNDPEDLEQPHPIFQDVDVRRAITMGFDRQRVIEMLLLDQTTIPATPLSNTRWENEQLEPIPFDPERAAELLEQAGWEVGEDGIRHRDGEPLSFTISTVAGDDPNAVLRQRIQEAFIEDMTALGIDVRPDNYDRQDLFGTPEEPGILSQRSFDMVDIPWNNRATLDTFIERFSEPFIPTEAFPEGDNVMGYNDPDVTRILRQQAVTLDPAERDQLLDEAQAMIMDDQPMILIYDHIEIDVARNYVHGLNPGPVTGLWWNVEEWWVSTEEVLD